MDNASKAIVMAGGVMIALAIISVSLYFYSNAKGYAAQSEELIYTSQIQSFNRFYTAYSSEVRGIDAVNILNRALEDGVEAVESSDIIEDRSGDYFSIPDSKNYTGTKLKYDIVYDEVGLVSEVKISDL